MIQLFSKEELKAELKIRKKFKGDKKAEDKAIKEYRDKVKKDKADKIKVDKVKDKK